MILKDYYRDNSDVIELDKTDFSSEGKIINPMFKNKFGLLKVYADWCGHCKNMKQMLNFLSSELKDEEFIVGALNYGSYDKDNKPDFLKTRINSFPTLLMVNYDGNIETLPKSLTNSMDDILDNICHYTEKASTTSKKTKVCKKLTNKLIDM